MNKFLLVAVVIVFTTFSSYGQVIWYWTGAQDNLWNNSNNWSDGTFSGVPTSGDFVIFDNDASSANCVINVSTANLGNFSISNGYSGIITQSPGVTVTVQDFLISSGTFAGGNASLTINGSFTQTGGTFIATSGITRLFSTFTSDNGTFNHNNGTFSFTNNSFTVNSNITFYNVSFVNSNNTSGLTFTVASTINILNNLTISTSQFPNGLRPITLNGGIINVAGSLVLIGPTLSPTNGGGSATIILNGTGNQTITGKNNAGEIPLPNLEINTSTPRTIEFSAVGQSITVNGDLTFSGAGDVALNTGTVYVKGNLNLSNSGVNGGGNGTIVLNNTTTAQTINGNNTIGNSTLPNLTIAKGTAGLTFLNTVSIGGTLTYSNSGAITNTGSTIAYVGGAQQVLAPTGNFPNYNILAIGGTTAKTVSSDVVTGSLVMNSADLNLGSFYLRVNNTASNAITYNGPGKVIGTLERAVTTGTNYTYQVGLENGPLQRLDINFSSTGSDNEYVSIKFNDGSTINDSEVSDATEAGVTFDRVIQGGYWEINGNGTDETGAIYTVSLYPQGFSFGTEETYTVLKRKDLGNWEALGTPISDPEDHISSTVISRSNVTGFSNLGVGAASFVPTPVDLYSFHAKLVEDHVQLDWVTLSETKSSHFVIERSRDSHSFDSIGTVLSAGNSSERLEYNFADLTATDILAKVLYYRLKQVDVDGQSKTYPMVGVDVEDIIRNSKIKIFPNPATVDVTVASYLKEDVHLDIYNPLGKVVAQKEISSEKTTVDTSNLEPGVYVFKFINGSTVINKKVIIK